MIEAAVEKRWQIKCGLEFVFAVPLFAILAYFDIFWGTKRLSPFCMGSNMEDMSIWGWCFLGRSCFILG